MLCQDDTSEDAFLCSLYSYIELTLNNYCFCYDSASPLGWVVDDLHELQKGAYIINGRRVLVK